MHNSKIGAVLGAALALAGVALWGPASAQDKKLTEIVYAAGQPAMSIGTAFYSSLPEDAGLHARYAGATVKIQPTAGSTAALQAISSGNADYAWSGLLSFFSIGEKDPNLVIVAFDPGNPYRIFAPAESDIKDVESLKGKKIGVQSFASANYSMAIAILSAAGLDPKADVTFIPVGVGAAAAEALRTDAIQAYAGNDANAPVIGILLGNDMRELASPVNDMPGMNGLVFSRKALEEQPDVVAGLCKAFYAGPFFARGNKEAVVLNHWRRYPDQKPSNTADDVALRDGVHQLEFRLNNLAKLGEDGLLGYQSLETMQNVVNKLHELGASETAPDLSRFVDLRLAKKCGEVTQAELDALAKEAEGWSGPASAQ